MRDLTADIQDAAGALAAPPWGEDVAERALVGFHRKRRRRQRIARAGAMASIVVVAAGAGLLGARMFTGAAPPAAPVIARAPRPEVRSLDRVQRLRDGSLALAVGEASELAVAEDSPTRVRARVARGRGRFQVARNPARQFRVEADGVAVTALGTIFEVARESERVAVSVEEGRVLVEWSGGQRELGAGDSGRFPPAAEEPARRPAPRPGWAALARARKYQESYALLERSAPPPVWTAEELMLAADAARLSGHPAKAVPYLERTLREHRRDERAPLAAFMLGRVLLHQLDAPADAAERFAEARALAPSSTLAEDALAREVEAWARAGRPDRARARAEEYLRRHPGGARADSVRQYVR